MTAIAPREGERRLVVKAGWVSLPPVDILKCPGCLSGGEHTGTPRPLQGVLPSPGRRGPCFMGWKVPKSTKHRKELRLP